MSTVVAIAVLVALFALFPLIRRERGPRECGGGGCWKKRLGFGCGQCPLDDVDPASAAGKGGQNRAS